MLRATWTILTKDVRLRLRDRSVFVFALIVPLGLTMVFSAILPEEEDVTLAAAIVDEDGGDASAPFATDVLPELVATGLVELDDQVTDLDAAVTALEAGDLDAVWHFPEGFTDTLQTSGRGELVVLVNPDRPLRAEVARGIADTYASELDRLVLAVATTSVVQGRELDPEEFEAVSAAVLQGDELAAVVPLVAESRRLGMTSYLAAGMAAFFLFFTVQFGVTGLLEERQLGTLPRLLAAPIHPGAVHLGKAAGAFILGITSMTVLAVAAATFLGADWGPPAGSAILILALVAAAMGLMAFVGTFAKTAEQASNLQSIVAVVLGMLGGVFFPLPLGEGILRHLTLIAPHGWFLRGLGDQVGTGQWWSVLPAAGAIVLFGVVTAALAAFRLQRRSRW